MNPEEENAQRLANIAEALKKMIYKDPVYATGSRSASLVPVGSNPYGTDPLAKAGAIARALDDQVEYSIRFDMGVEYILWRTTRGTEVVSSVGPVRVQMETFMDVSFTDIDIANVFGLDRKGRGVSRKDADRMRRMWLDKDGFRKQEVSTQQEINEAISTLTVPLAMSLALSPATAAKMATSFAALAAAGEESAKTIKAVGEIIPRMDDEKMVKARAEAGVDAIIHDISAEMLNGDDAVRELASKYLTEVTTKITALLATLDQDGTDG